MRHKLSPRTTFVVSTLRTMALAAPVGAGIPAEACGGALAGEGGADAELDRTVSADAAAEGAAATREGAAASDPDGAAASEGATASGREGAAVSEAAVCCGAKAAAGGFGDAATGAGVGAGAGAGALRRPAVLRQTPDN